MRDFYNYPSIVIDYVAIFLKNDGTVVNILTYPEKMAEVGQ